MSNPKIALRDLHLYYGDFHALKGLSMEIPEKEITAFIGPSGCGKSTCLKTLNRMNGSVANDSVNDFLWLSTTMRKYSYPPAIHSGAPTHW